MTNDSLGDRMKGYESIPALQLMRRTPVIIRLDGKAFHTFTRGMNRPFDDRLIQTMQETTQALVKNIEGCNFGYTQSDEISLLLTDYKNLETQAWFDYKVQKMVSVAASMATAYFNGFLVKNFLDSGNGKVAFFDARAFNIPRDEVVNCFVWRQQDSTRNSIQMVARANFSHKELENKSCDEIQEMLWSQKQINWNDTPTHKKRGTCVYKKSVLHCAGYLNDKNYKGYDPTVPVSDVYRTEYFIDTEIPIFTQDRGFIQKWVDVDKSRE